MANSKDDANPTTLIDPSRLARHLKTNDAVILGLGSMIGAGIFAAAGPAAAAAGSGLLIAVLIAGGIAYLNAMTMAQLAAVYPESGGAYVYGRKRLGPIWGFLAGWGFVLGKLASCAAMALTFAYYACPEYARPLAVGAVLLLTSINYFGVKKTALVTRAVVAIVLFSLAIVAYASLAGGGVNLGRLTAWTERGGVQGILEASGLMFFAFAGYARIATLGEEIIEARKTIPRAMTIALSITLMVYVVIMTAAVLTVDINVLAEAKTPLTLAVESGKFSAFAPVVRMGACFASLGVLLSLMAGVSRTTFAMAANRDLPYPLSSVHPVHQVPHRAEITVGLIVAAIASVGDLRSTIGFSSFAILTYYSIANIAAWTLEQDKRLWPKWMSLAGLIGCITVAFHLPLKSAVGGIALYSLGLLVYFLNHRFSDPKT